MFQLAMDTDDDAVVGVVTTLLLSKHKNKSKRKKRRYWVHPYNHINLKHGSYIVSKELSEHPDKFQSFYRMSVQTFSRLVSLVGPHIIKKDTNFRLALGVEEKLLITLRYLATGSLFRTLSFYFMRGETTIGYVVNETCKAIWKYLKTEYMRLPSENMWLEIARRYEELWNMPNCVGSIDGKYIRIQAPPKCGSAYYNYKSYNSMVLMAIADADSMFTMISVGDYGRNSDGAVFTNSRIGSLLNENKLHIPPARSLPCDSGGPFPMFFVADEAFALRQEIMKPYPQRTLNNERRIFNYRVSRARKSVEFAFGILCSKFRVFHSPIACNVDKAENIVKAACVLHNFIRKHDGVLVSPDTSLQLPQNLNNRSQLRGRPTTAALQLRDRLCQYFVKPEVALPWQNTVCV